ncbi:MAG: hypothetical protein K8T25_00480 [Planctomycetia bacterium]|nr:hypothetical protein [Planctomycetia bacterium]
MRAIPGIFVVLLGVVLVVMCLAAPPTYMAAPLILGIGVIGVGLVIVYVGVKKKPPKKRSDSKPFPGLD